MVLFWRFTIRESIEPGESCWLVELASCCCRLRLAAAVVDDARCRRCRCPPLGDDDDVKVKVKVKVVVVIGRRRRPRHSFSVVAERAKGAQISVDKIGFN
jgi:hypothetical protein